MLSCWFPAANQEGRQFCTNLHIHHAAAREKNMHPVSEAHPASHPATSSSFTLVHSTTAKRLKTSKRGRYHRPRKSVTITCSAGPRPFC